MISAQLSLVAPTPARSAGARVAALLAALGTLALYANGWAAGGSGPGGSGPTVELITMGPGGTLFDGFGHAALRVRDPARRTEAVYSFGALTYTGPLLGWRFLRGEVLFKARVRAFGAVMRSYRRQDRTVYRQRLRLRPNEARRLAEALREAVRPENSHYVYHHFNENCATRLRDLVDEATGGALRHALAGPGDGTTARQQVLRGLSLSPPLLLVMNVVQGRPTDVPLTARALTFVPGELRLAMQKARRPAPPGEQGELLADPVEVLYERQAPLRRWPIEWGGRLAWILALPFAALGGLLLLRRRRARGGGADAPPDRLAGALLGSWALLGGALGLALDTVAMSDLVPEFRYNENLALYVALDLLLLGPAVLLLLRRLRGRWRAGVRWYLAVRATVALAVTAAQAVGLLRQEPLALGALVAVATGTLAAALAAGPGPSGAEPEGANEGRQGAEREEQGGVAH